MNFSALSERSLPGKLLRLPLRLLPAEAQMPILQGRLRGKKWIVGSSIHGCWLGSYEYEKQQLFAQHIISGSVVYDIGAHAGFYTLLASVLVGTAGRVIALEPVPRNLFYLKEHLRINAVRNVQVLETAVADRRGMARFDEGVGSSQGRLAAQGSLSVPVTTLDTLVFEEGLPCPDAIKIDVEGAELLVLSGAKTLLARRHPTLFLATHGAAVHNECCTFLRSLGYRLSPITGHSIEATDELLAFQEAGQ